MKIINKFHNTKRYLSRYWDTQKTKKYLIEINDKLIEVGYFIHYMGDDIVRHVVELSTSYGCPMKCKFCASSLITQIDNLTREEICEVFEYVYAENNLSACEYVLVALMGIGDLYFTSEITSEFIL